MLLATFLDLEPALPQLDANRALAGLIQVLVYSGWLFEGVGIQLEEPSFDLAWNQSL
jgi:hypothetical protein